MPDHIKPIKTTQDFDNIINFRDVGKTVNEFLGKRLVKEGLLFRSARPDDATVDDRRRLREEFVIRTVMDLRTKTEHVNQAKKRSADLKIPALVQSNAALAEPVQIPGLQYREIRLTGKSFERFLISNLSWWSFIKLIFLFITGYRTQAIAIMGREVMQPRGLVGLGLDTLDHSTAEIAEALKALFEPGSLPLLVHCTQGKDRTGLVVSLALMILGIPLDAVDFDYILSNDELIPEKAERVKEIREMGLSDDFGDTAPDMISKQAEHLNAKYGGLDNYLNDIGFSLKDRERMREVFLY